MAKVLLKKNNHIRIIISGGGTGGHVYPAIAIADALKSIDESIEILFVGAEGKMEMEKVPQAGYRIIGLWVSGLQRKLTVKNLMFPFKLLHSLWKARRIVKEFKPQAVVGVGGYASGPVLKAANAKQIPTVLQEQNGYAGLTNKLLAQKAQRVCVAYPNMEKYFPENKIRFTGNPVRNDIMQLEGLREKAFEYFRLDPQKKTLLVFGGSLGAKTINDSLLQAIEVLLKKGYQIVWQTGKFYYNQLQVALEGKKGNGLWLGAFIDRMDYAYAVADLVVCRAGALSISELCLAAKATVLIPSPNVAEDHQTKNAMALVNEKAAIMVKDSEAREQFTEVVLDLLHDDEKREDLSKNICKLGKPNAAKDIAEEVLNLVKQKV
ncbi:undecaprenyldiphospho-muramoylpentapeptide beta-N-acetylglucosaminyltransferase [Rapidithrix thailandica]|uniref:UDP-N-acetylglucosamine--N-acetylmuramyl-(pentapeptide) pyrophosphoryl-undecaprenol N-acetylglucosamine transferase n=1 Tax=Rapidithrix thailandica TaxID=413964 RepID=A0AAW9SDW0_9BACT